MNFLKNCTAKYMREAISKVAVSESPEVPFKNLESRTPAEKFWFRSFKKSPKNLIFKKLMTFYGLLELKITGLQHETLPST